MIVANDATVKGGTYYPMTVRKHLRAQEVALHNHLPCIYLVDSGGAFLPMQDEVFPDREHFGRIFYNQATMSARGIPQLSAVLGSSTAGGAYVPAMSDETVIVREQGTIFLGGPPLVRAATGEVVTAEELGGGDVHARISASPTTWPTMTRTRCASCARSSPPSRQPRRRGRWRRAEGTRREDAELYGVVPTDWRTPYDVREVIAASSTGAGSRSSRRLRRDAGCGFARLHGHPVGIVANNGILFSESALKGAHFVELCDQRRIPLVFLQNITGFMVGRQYEAGGIAKDGAKLVTAVACARVPKFTVIDRRLVRGRQLRHVRARVLAPLPVDVAERADLGDGRRPGRQRAGHGAAGPAGGRRRAVGRRGRGRVQAADPRAVRAPGNPYYSTARLWDDGIIDPLDTRQVLGLALSAAANAPLEPVRYGIFRM